MRHQDEASFSAAAKSFQAWILVRPTNKDSLVPQFTVVRPPERKTG